MVISCFRPLTWVEQPVPPIPIPIPIQLLLIILRRFPTPQFIRPILHLFLNLLTLLLLVISYTLQIWLWIFYRWRAFRWQSFSWALWHQSVCKIKSFHFTCEFPKSLHTQKCRIGLQLLFWMISTWDDSASFIMREETHDQSPDTWFCHFTTFKTCPCAVEADFIMCWGV